MIEYHELGSCDTYWRSHGCNLEEGHDGDHMCCPHLGEPDRCQTINCDDDECPDVDYCHNETPRPGDRLYRLDGSTIGIYA